MCWRRIFCDHHTNCSQAGRIAGCCNGQTPQSYQVLEFGVHTSLRHAMHMQVHACWLPSHAMAAEHSCMGTLLHTSELSMQCKKRFPTGQAAERPSLLVLGCPEPAWHGQAGQVDHAETLIETKYLSMIQKTRLYAAGLLAACNSCHNCNCRSSTRVTHSTGGCLRAAAKPQDQVYVNRLLLPAVSCCCPQSLHEVTNSTQLNICP